ncbi:MAG TPA: DUF192 domain-containing protein [Chthonomonadales bacterium]|nr:DUF192 domain-containing protein [Chthonomonadales bacterium]
MSRTVRLVCVQGGAPVCERAHLARDLWARLVGLALHSTLPPGEGLWLAPCNGVHTAFMRFAIDVVALDRELRVLTVHANVAPWRLVHPRRGWHSALELPAGEASRVGIRAGQQLRAETVP